MAGYDKKMERDRAPGWIYLLHFPLVEGAFFKIGLSRQPFQRLNQLKKESWTFGCVIMAACFWTDDMATDESFLLERYDKYRSRDGNEYLQMTDGAVACFIHDARCLSRDAIHRQQHAARAAAK